MDKNEFIKQIMSSYRNQIARVSGSMVDINLPNLEKFLDIELNILFEVIKYQQDKIEHLEKLVKN